MCWKEYFLLPFTPLNVNWVIFIIFSQIFSKRSRFSEAKDFYKNFTNLKINSIKSAKTKSTKIKLRVTRFDQKQRKSLNLKILLIFPLRLGPSYFEQVKACRKYIKYIFFFQKIFPNHWTVNTSIFQFQVSWGDRLSFHSNEPHCGAWLTWLSLGQGALYGQMVPHSLGYIVLQERHFQWPIEWTSRLTKCYTLQHSWLPLVF